MRKDTRIDSQGIVRHVRRRTYRAVVSERWQIQTYRIYVTLACGHKTTYTTPGAKRNAPQPKRRDCWHCREGVAQP